MELPRFEKNENNLLKFFRIIIMGNSLKSLPAIQSDLNIKYRWVIVMSWPYPYYIKSMVWDRSETWYDSLIEAKKEGEKAKNNPKDVIDCSSLNVMIEKQYIEQYQNRCDHSKYCDH